MAADDCGSLVDGLSRLAERGLANASTMPGEVYVSRAFFDLEQERIFSREWHCAGRAESIPEPGDYLTWRIGAQPLPWSARRMAR